MKKEKTDKRKKIGLPPGSLIYVGKNLKEKVTIEAFIYDEESYIETEIKKIDEINKEVGIRAFVWNVEQTV